MNCGARDWASEPFGTLPGALSPPWSEGAKPADLPVEQPTEFDFGLTIPDTVLFRADRVIK